MARRLPPMQKLHKLEKEVVGIKRVLADNVSGITQQTFINDLSQHDRARENAVRREVADLFGGGFRNSIKAQKRKGRRKRKKTRRKRKKTRRKRKTRIRRK